MAKHTKEELKQWQSLPLEIKILMTKERIREWIKYYGEDGVYIAFSGGKDSTVLLDIIRQDYPRVKAMFVDVPTQYPELKEFVKTFENVDIVKPKIGFAQVCEKYGFPLFSKEIAECIQGAKKYLTFCKDDKGDDEKKKPYYYWYERVAGIGRFDPVNGKKVSVYDKRMYSLENFKFMLDSPFEVSALCCKIFKKEPSHRYSKETKKVAITGQMAYESRLRTQAWIKAGCNAFEAKNPVSNPLSFWTEQDVLKYIKDHNLKICSLYGDVVSDDEEIGQMQLADYEGFNDCKIEDPPLHCTGCDRTGCVLCGFGAHMNDNERYIRLKETHPKMYALLDVVQNNGYTFRQAIEWISENSDKIIKL